MQLLPFPPGGLHATLLLRRSKLMYIELLANTSAPRGASELDLACCSLGDASGLLSEGYPQLLLPVQATPTRVTSAHTRAAAACAAWRLMRPPVCAGHEFCASCVQMWQQRSTRCPVCRADQGIIVRLSEAGHLDSSSHMPSGWPLRFSCAACSLLQSHWGLPGQSHAIRWVPPLPLCCKQLAPD